MNAAQRGFMEVTILYDAIVEDTRHHTAAQTPRMYDSKSDSNVNCALQLIMHQREFVSCDKCTTPTPCIKTRRNWWEARGNMGTVVLAHCFLYTEDHSKKKTLILFFFLKTQLF